MVKKTASIVASLIIMLAIGGFVFVRNFDLNRYKSYIEDMVYQNTGRKLAMNGDAKVGLSLIPTLVVNDVTFANPEWAQNPYMAKLEKLEVKFSLSALLHRKINIQKFILIKPEIYLEKSKDGKTSWDFNLPKSQGGTQKSAKSNTSGEVRVNPASTLAVGLIAKEVRLEDGNVVYFDAKGGSKIQVVLNEVELEAEGGDEPMKLSVDAIYDDKPIAAEFKMSNIEKILNSGNINFEGVVNALKVKSSINGQASNVMGDVKYSVEADVHNPAGNFGAPETSLLARVDGDVKQADINIRSLNVATNLITGAVKVDWSGVKPYITANLKSDVFNVNSLSKNSMLSDLHFDIINSAQALTMVPNDKIPYQYLNLVNGVFNIKAGKLILPNELVLMDILLNAKINGGVLNISKFDTSVYGGKVSVNGVVNAAKHSIAAKIDASNIKFINLYNVLVDDDDFSVSNGGLLDMEADLTTNGATYRQCSENLNGKFTALVGKTVAKTGHIDWLVDGVVAELFKLLKIDTSKHNELNIECAVVNTQIKGGKAEFNKGIVFNSDKLQIMSSGNVNLVNDKIDFTISPTLNKLSSGNLTQALASFVRLGGSLQKPSLKLDKTSAVSTVVGTIATNGLYLGGEVLMGGNDNLCYNALQGTKYVARFPKKESAMNSAKESYQDVAEQARDAAKEISDTAKGLWKSLKSNLKGK